MMPVHRIHASRVPLATGLIVVSLGLGACAGGSGGEQSGARDASASAASMPSAPTGHYAFWPQFPAEPRLQFVRAISWSDDVAPGSTSAFDKIVFGADARDSAPVNKPYGVAMRDGKIYVCDIRNASLTVLDLRKRQTRLIGVSGMNPLKRPVSVVVADDGEIYVADVDRGAILVFDAQERYARAMGHPGLKPAALALRADRLYVTNMAGQCVEWYDRASGEQKGSFGTVGDDSGQFRLPLGIAIDPDGNVYVADMMACRVQEFTPDGKFISGFGSLGDFAGAFVRPKHIAIDKEGIIYVVDAAFQNVQLFDKNHKLLMHFGASGTYPGAMNLPAGVCVDDSSLDLCAGLVHPGFDVKRIVVVTNQFGDQKVNLYAMGGVAKGYSAKDLAAAAITVPSGMGEGAKFLPQNPVPGTEVEPPPAGLRPEFQQPPSGKPADTSAPSKPQ